jgi:hypothetical protein
MKVRELAKITGTSLKVSVVNADEDKRFKWRAAEFASSYLKLQLAFETPLRVSAEGARNRDLLEVRVLIPFLFQAEASNRSIPRGEAATAPIPQQLSR